MAFRRAVTPEASVMSNSAGSAMSGTSQSKWSSRLASGSSTLARPNAIPGHILLPAPNGRSWKSVPLKSTVEDSAPTSKRSGQNSSIGCFGPALLVPAQRPGVDDDPRPPRHVKPEHLAGFSALAWDQQRHRRVQTERLPDDEVQVWQLTEPVLDHPAAALEGSAHLSRRLLHHRWVLDQFRHGPFKRRGRRLASGGEEILYI